MHRLILPTAMLLLAAGCSSQVPLAVNHPLSSQLKIKSSQHWDVLADDVAAQTAAFLQHEPRKEGASSQKPIYLAAPQQPSAFDRAFQNFLVTRMVNRGLLVSSRNGGGIELSYETQLVRHESPRYAHAPGTLTTLGAGVWVVRELVQGSFAAFPGAMGLTALADWGIGKFAGAPSSTELIVTTSITSEHRFVFRKSDIYYIEAEDGDLFLALNEKGRAVEPAGNSRGVKLLEVVGQ